TQVNSERFITEELKDKESLILGAEEKSIALEYELFQKIIVEISKYIGSIQMVADKIAILDCILAFAKVAIENNYCKPNITQNNIINIKNGRHPVIERMVDDFVPNDCRLDEDNSMVLITGPNMAGKSTFLRQNALIVLMAHIGSFIPAENAELCIVDRIFTRVGAYDDLAHGQSTFMVEMSETANILNNATEMSLIILDEIGRGTSTYDGVSLAWAIVEYINKYIKAKTLFATHYHHLNNLSQNFPTIKNFNVAVAENGDEIIFLHKIVEGGTDKSYGIHVAKLAGLPKYVIERSKSIMQKIEMEDDIGELLDKNLDSEEIKERLNKIRKSIASEQSQRQLGDF
ncbi:MAG: DNA mismatch repair protein MutS, partial [Nanoarchaeota archaeon]